MSTVNPVQAKDPASGVVYTFTDGMQLAQAMQNQQYVPIQSNGTPYNVQIFEGGYLLNGAPLNAAVNGFWYDGQQAALMPYWQNGTIPIPSTGILGEPVEAMPAALASQTAAGIAASSSTTILGLPWYIWAAGAAVLLLK